MKNILVIGNPTIDFVEGQYFGSGGPVVYVANSLAKLGEKKINIVSSFGNDFCVENFIDKSNIFILKSNLTNKFDFHFRSGVRNIYASEYGKKIKSTDIKLDKHPEIIYISPVLNEFSINETKSLIDKYKNSTFVGMPQGWIRKILSDEVKIDFSNIHHFPIFDILFFSEEEIMNSNFSLENFKKLSKILVITRGDKGASVYQGNTSYDFHSKRVDTVSTIGAGDIFATVFSNKLLESKSISYAAEAANHIAAKSTMFKGLKSINSGVFKLPKKNK